MTSLGYPAGKYIASTPFLELGHLSDQDRQ